MKNYEPKMSTSSGAHSAETGTRILPSITVLITWIHLQFKLKSVLNWKYKVTLVSKLNMSGFDRMANIGAKFLPSFLSSKMQRLIQSNRNVSKEANF